MFVSVASLLVCVCVGVCVSVLMCVECLSVRVCECVGVSGCVEKCMWLSVYVKVSLSV